MGTLEQSIIIENRKEGSILIIPLSNIDEITLERVNGHKKIRITKKGSPASLTFFDTDVSCPLFTLLL